MPLSPGVAGFFWPAAPGVNYFDRVLNRFSLKELRNFLSRKRLHSHFSSFFNYFLTIRKHLSPPAAVFLR
ncbi:hypothetical protein EGH67_19820 [Klebsiella aerogenes]|nr:hypothetical protein CRN78_24400 [Klebsiella aerogenes]KAA0468215.1 hypothetical protein F0333_14570 [Klebsiella aerogenes]MBK1469902.1 hypothetical protein [Klebsiella aerogenes]OVK42523.1 hypothetical protein B8043_06580 [Klebsiella aerogenes]RSV70683.1 hypothetical protein EGH60_14125 [Klebsiella aerogenes]